MLKYSPKSTLDPDLEHMLRPIFGSRRQEKGHGQGRDKVSRKVTVAVVLLVDCASHLDEIQQSCEVDDGVAGVCCPVSEAAAGSTTTRVTTRGIFSPASVSASLPSLDSSKMAQSLNAGLNRSALFNQVEENLIE
nr:uncharacterized protein LOC128705490 [Cherax quadricarinatus]